MINEVLTVEPLEVVISFLVANDTASFENNHKPFNSETLLLYVKQQFSIYRKLSNENLETKIHDKNRLKRVLEHRWFLQKVPLKYIGTWPGVGDLPKEWSVFSAVDIGKRLEDADKTLASIKKIYAMATYINEILQLLPPILVMGGEIRDVNNYFLMPFDADDGSHRCIAAALRGVEEINCYVGLP